MIRKQDGKNVFLVLKKIKKDHSSTQNIYAVKMYQ